MYIYKSCIYVYMYINVNNKCVYHIGIFMLYINATILSCIYLYCVSGNVVKKQRFIST